jgi:hypothetical protein
MHDPLWHVIVWQETEENGDLKLITEGGLLAVVWFGRAAMHEDVSNFDGKDRESGHTHLEIEHAALIAEHGGKDPALILDGNFSGRHSTVKTQVKPFTGREQSMPVHFAGTLRAWRNCIQGFGQVPWRVIFSGVKILAIAAVDEDVLEWQWMHHTFQTSTSNIWRSKWVCT